jgi:ferredoxin
LEDEVPEPFYAARRKNTIIITTDCAEIAPTCFCTVLDDLPYAEKGFDINLSPIEAGFVVEAGSERGKEILARAQGLIREASDEQLAQRKAMRQKTIEALNEQNAPYKFDKPIYQIVTEARESGKWDKLVVPCVECGACTQICPACYCFYLYDQPSEYRAGLSERIKGWDSCLYADYGKMAGVAGMKPTPRPTLANRLRHRFLHKYSYAPEKFECFGCTGCGRCIDACSGAIDVREVIKELAE